MTYTIPVIDLGTATRADASAGLLDAIRAATEEIGIVQVVNKVFGRPEQVTAGAKAYPTPPNWPSIRQAASG